MKIIICLILSYSLILPLPSYGAEVEYEKMPLDRFLAKAGGKFGLYFTVEDLDTSGSGGNILLNSFVEADMNNITNMEELMFFLTNTVNIVRRYNGNTNNITISAERLYEDSPVISIKDSRLASMKNYALDDPITLEYEGTPTDFVEHLSLINKKIKAPGGFLTTGGGMHGWDGSTRITVKATEKPIRNVLTDCIPLDGYSRIIWYSNTDGNTTNPAVVVNYNGGVRGIPNPITEKPKIDDEKNFGWHRDKFPMWERPGDGWHGITYGWPSYVFHNRMTPQLQKLLDEYPLSARLFLRDSEPDDYINTGFVNNLPYLLFTPAVGFKQQKQAVPMVIYFGEYNKDDANSVSNFQDTTIFSKITSAEFQQKHPCYLFAPTLPPKTRLRGSGPERPYPLADLICDAMYSAVRMAKNPPVDINRIYLVGLSNGGAVAFDLPNAYPGRFAASVPVSFYNNAASVNKTAPVNYWLLFNDEEFNSESARDSLVELAKTVKGRGGDYRQSSFPDAWDKVLREDAVWDWMFSKTADEKSAEKNFPAWAKPPSMKPGTVGPANRCSIPQHRNFKNIWTNMVFRQNISSGILLRTALKWNPLPVYAINFHTFCSRPRSDPNKKNRPFRW